LLLQVEYQLEFAEWLMVSGTEPGSKEHTAEALLLAAAATLTQLEEAAAEGALVQRASCCCTVLQMCCGYAAYITTGSEHMHATAPNSVQADVCLMHLGYLCCFAEQGCSAPGDGDDAASVVSKAQTVCTTYSQIRGSKSSSPRRPPGAPGSTISSTALGRKTGTGSIVTISSKATGRRAGRAATVRGTGSQQHADQADAAAAGQQHGFTVRHMDQLVRAHMLLSQVGWCTSVYK
jgi:hypothetical protein